MSDRETLDGVLERVTEAAPGTTYRRRRGGDQPLESAGGGCRELTGYDGSALSGGDRAWLDVVHPDDRDDLREATGDLTPGDSIDVTYRIRRSDGERRWVRDRATLGEPDVLDGVVLDVTDERERLAELEDDSQLLDGIFESIPVHLFVKDETGEHLRVSDYLDVGEPLVGKTDRDVGGKNDEARREAYEDDLRVVETGEPIIDKEEYLPELDQWNLTSKVPWTNDEGDVVGLIGVARDITERKRAQQKLERKTERLEEFADVVSHDIKNPLTVANGHLELARATGDADHVEEVVDALDRADAIIDDVFALSKHEDGNIDPEPVSLRKISHGAAHSITAPRADISLPPDVEIEADRSQLRRLLENLFKNAVEHGSTSPGSASPRQDAVQHGSPDVSIDVRVAEDGFAVADDGPGIPDEERDQVFETAYTTHEDGTGFGLAIVTEIADAHGWSVAVDESAAGGARFEITGVERPDDP